MKAIIAFSLDLENANDNLRRYGYRLQWRNRALASFGAYVNQPDMTGVPFSELEDLYWYCMPSEESASVGPYITLHPSNSTVDVNGDVTLKVGANGPSAVTYLWEVNTGSGWVAAGSTSTTLDITSAQFTDSGNQYRVQVTSGTTKVTNVAILTVTDPQTQAPVITVQPVAETVAEYGIVTQLSVTATHIHSADLFYSWKINRGNGYEDLREYGSTLDVTNGPDYDGYDIVVEVSAYSEGNATVTSDIAVIHRYATDSLPIVTGKTAHDTYDRYSEATLEVFCTNATRYAWYRDGVYAPELGEESSITITVTGDTGYSCNVVNDNGVTPSGTILVFAAEVAPVITEQPQSGSVNEGDNLTFTVASDNTDSYQWRKDEVNIPGATNASFTITDIVVSDEGSYSCSLTNTAGSTNSIGVRAGVNRQAPFITEQPSPSESQIIGGSVTFTVESPNATAFDWYVNGKKATLNTPRYLNPYTNGLTIIDLVETDAGSIYANCHNQLGTTTSDVSVLTVTEFEGDQWFINGDELLMNGEIVISEDI